MVLPNEGRYLRRLEAKWTEGITDHKGIIEWKSTWWFGHISSRLYQLQAHGALQAIADLHDIVEPDKDTINPLFHQPSQQEVLEHMQSYETCCIRIPSKDFPDSTIGIFMFVRQLEQIHRMLMMHLLHLYYDELLNERWKGPLFNLRSTYPVWRVCDTASHRHPLSRVWRDHCLVPI